MENKSMKGKVIFAVALAASFFLGFGSRVAQAITNVDPNYPNHYAWSDTIGWINFLVPGTFNVTKFGLEGYAQFGDSVPYSYLSFDCASGPIGSNCAPVNYRVTNDANGNLSGWAWSDTIGWVSFDCHNPETGGSSPDYSCTQSLYRVKIDSSGNFSGFAWNDIVGWISFNCNQTETGNLCATSNYKVMANWAPGAIKGDLQSGTFDTKSIDGVAFNFILWKGQLNSGRVGFQLATSNCDNGATNAPTCDANIGWGGSKSSGDGAFLGPGGTTVVSDIYVPSGPDVALEIRNQSTHNNKRYFRYKAYLETDIIQTATPVVEDVIVNWSP